MIARPLRKVFVALLFLAGAGALAAQEQANAVLLGRNMVKGQSIVASIDFLASSYCRGRETGDRGIDLAAKFITTLFSAAGLTPAGDYGGYYQSVPLRRVTLGEPLALSVEEGLGAAKRVSRAKLELDFLPITLSGEGEVEAPLLFAGYGITAPEYAYDDYRGIDAKGKIVLLLRHEPREKEEGDYFEGVRTSNYGTILAKILNAQKHGAAAVMIVNDPLNHPDANSNLRVAIGGTYWPQLSEERLKKDEDFKYLRFEPNVRIAGKAYGVSIPAVGVSGQFVADLLGEGRSLLDLQKGIDRDKKPNSFMMSGKKASLAVHFKYEPLAAYNLVAKIEGSDPALKEEAVLIGAHYDHLGKDNRGLVFGGADDNASGTAAVVEIARAFKSMAVKPKRTLLFVLFCGEEMGLLGSRYYCEQPVVPLEKTVAMINLDMIARNDIGQLNVLGKYQYPKFFAIVDEINRKTANFDFNFTVESSIMGSDHFPFMRQNVPSIFFITGMHDQYHRPEDRVGLVSAEKVEKVAQLAFLTMWQASNLPAGTVLK